MHKRAVASRFFESNSSSHLAVSSATICRQPLQKHVSTPNFSHAAQFQRISGLRLRPFVANDLKGYSVSVLGSLRVAAQLSAELQASAETGQESLTMTESQWMNGRGQQLFTISYVAAQPRASLVWHHGYGEHVGRMKNFFSQLAASGISVFSYDVHGHGKSQPHSNSSRAYVAAFTDLVDDLEAFIKVVRDKTPPETPLFVGGQSMGGLVAAHVALPSGPMLSGLVLTSALVDVEWTPMLRFQAKFGNALACLMPRARLVDGVRPEDMSPDAAVVKDFKEDSLNFVGKVRARTSNELLKGFRELNRRKRELCLPVFAVHGTKDHCTSQPAVESLLKDCSSSDKTFQVVEGGYHELLLGPEKEDVIAMITTWLLQHSSPAAPSPAPIARL